MKQMQPNQPKFNTPGYGSSRLQIQNQAAQNEISDKSTTLYSLFNPDGMKVKYWIRAVIMVSD